MTRWQRLGVIVFALGLAAAGAGVWVNSHTAGTPGPAGSPGPSGAPGRAGPAVTVTLTPVPDVTVIVVKATPVPRTGPTPARTVIPSPTPHPTSTRTRTPSPTPSPTCTRLPIVGTCRPVR